MGLDMYAARRFYVKNWDHYSASERYQVTVSRGGNAIKGIQPERITWIEEEVMYWRKANHIHAWFVDNVQKGDDPNDGRIYLVSWEKLKELLSTCKKVLKASELVDGQVYAGTVYDAEHPNGLVQSEPGKVVKDTTVAEELLPTCSGFFFGCEDYDEYYLRAVEETARWAASMLQDNHDGVPGEIFYSSSW